VNTSIGAFCSIGANVKIGLPDHPLNFVSTHPAFYDPSQPILKSFTTTIHHQASKTTTLGHDVWIGDGAFIRSGVTIGTGAVVAAGSVVVKDVDPYSIVGGNPAQHIKYRFDKETVGGLLKSRWWTFNDRELSQFSEEFIDPKAFAKREKF
jgi:acetyltransferase-like isoleucine patch superfamily enzyme